MTGLISLFLLGTSALVYSSPVKSRSPYALKETHVVPPQWTRVRAKPGDAVLDLHIGLKQGQFDELERHLYEVSDPDHLRYGQHLSPEEVNRLVQPTDETTDLVHEWLADHGIFTHDMEYSAAKDWIKVSLPVNKVEHLLDTKYAVFKHKEDGDHVLRTTSWSLPRHLHEHIETIQPTTSFFRIRKQRSTVKIVGESKFNPPVFRPQPPAYYALNASQPDVSAVCNASIVTPTCLRTLYNTIDYTPQVPGQNRIALTNYLNETSNLSDTRIFLQTYRPDALTASGSNDPAKPLFETIQINNGDIHQTPNAPGQRTGIEGNLDAETILGIGSPTPLITYNTGGSPPFQPSASTTSNTNEPYLDWLAYVLNQTDIPQTISTSYGDDEQTVPYSYATAVCRQFAQLGARGVSLFFSSGDAGVGGNGTCILNNGNRTAFTPDFPTSCPYITSVGATKNFNPEVAAYDPRNGFSSGGGFSNYFPTPAYQKKTVAAYIASLNGTYSGLYNTSGRAYPDVSAQGQLYAVIWNGTRILVDGTSASTPAFASVISLVNDALIAAGKPPLGFLNPWLYKKGYQALNDVTSGSAIGCDGPGFPAKAGWDPVTGFGTPDFKKIRALLGV